jgi:hypothetical protein
MAVRHNQDPVTAARISATSEAVGQADVRKRKLAWKILQQSNQVVIGFAQMMVPTALAAVGVIVGLAQDTGRSPAHGLTRVLTVAASILVLVSAVMFAHTAYARRVRISEADYDRVLDELLAVATRRQREATVALGLLAVGVLIAVLALIT